VSDPRGRIVEKRPTLAGTHPETDMPRPSRRSGHVHELRVFPMRILFSIAYLVILIGCSLLAMRMWFAQRGTKDPAERQVFLRFVLGLAVFWLVAAVGYLGGFFSFSG